MKQAKGLIILNGVKHISLDNGISLNTVTTDKFKSNSLTIYLISPLTKENAALGALLPRVLSRRNSAYPDVKSLRGHLCDLYGADIVSGCEKRGEMQILSVGIRSVSPKFLPENVTDECVELLAQTLFNPVLVNGAFDTDDVEIEKKNLIDAINAEVNDKVYYAYIRMIEEMCKNEPFGTGKNGTAAAVAKITPEELTKYWKELIATSQIEVFAVGADNDEAALSNALKNAFSKIERQYKKLPEAKLITVEGEVKKIDEKMPLEQAKLVMGFRTGVSAPEDDTAAIMLANEIFGGSVNSKLFTNVREKLHLCYYCSSGIERYKGIMYIRSGIQAENKQKAIEEILSQLDAVKKGDFTEEEITAAKLSLSDEYRSIDDSLYGIESYYLGQLLSNTKYTPDEMANKIKDIKKEEIIDAFKNVKLDTIYCLEGEVEK